jgi:hypothetical protein
VQEVSGSAGVHPFGETGNFSGSGPLVDHTFLGSFADSGLGADKFSPFGFVGWIADRKAHIFDNILDPGFYRFVAQPLGLVLSGAFQSRFVICQLHELLSWKI